MDIGEITCCQERHGDSELFVLLLGKISLS